MRLKTFGECKVTQKVPILLEPCEIEELIGKIVIRVDVYEDIDRIGVFGEDSDFIDFYCEDGSFYRMFHNQDCCEVASIESISGELGDLVGTPILQAEVKTNQDDPKPTFFDIIDKDSFTWTFYTLATVNGYVDIRWSVCSNGYYSEQVDFCKIVGWKELKQ